LPKLSLPNPDTLAGFGMLWLIVLYLVLYDVLHIHGVVLRGFGLGYLTVLLPIWLIDGFKSSLESMTPHRYKNADEDLSKVAVVIACKDGEDVIGPTLKSLVRKFDPRQIVVASNGSTDRTCEIAREYGVKVLDFKEPLGKVRAINAALPYVIAPYVLLLDDDTMIAGATIPTGLLDQGYGAVAFRVLVKPETWVSKLQLHEYRKSFDIGRRYHNRRGSVQNISGAIGLFRRDALLWQIERHTGEFSGEDLQRTLLVHMMADQSHARAGGVVLSRSIVITQAPTTLATLYRQRSFGWFPGLYANFTNYLRIMANPRLPRLLRVEALYGCVFVCLLDILRLLSLPIMFFYPWYFVITYAAYVVMELPPYLRTGHVEPLWVILTVPLYGLFGFFTRMSAFATFVYRRLTFKLSHVRYFDDYRQAPPRAKFISAGLVLAGIATILVLNAVLNYSSYITGLHISF